MPDDFPIITDPQDTISEPIVECDTVVVTEPEFITIYNEYFNGLPDSLVWYFHVGQGNDIAYGSLELLLIDQGYHPDSIQVFHEGVSYAAIIRGTNDKSKIEGRIWTYDGLSGIQDPCTGEAIRQKALYVVNIQAFLFGGALTFEEYKQVAIDLPSVNIFNFRNTNWTQSQYEEVAKIILGECKLGRKEANFMFNAEPISCELYCQFFDRGWQIVRGQSCNCSPPPAPITKPIRA